MTRSLLRPIRTRRTTRSAKASHSEPASPAARLSPATRKTLAAMGALWVSFAVNASAAPVAPAEPESGADQAARAAPLDGSHAFMSPLIDCTDDDHRASLETDHAAEPFGILRSTLPLETVVPLSAPPATTSRTTLPPSESRDVVFLTTGAAPDGAAPTPEPAARPKGKDGAAVLAYLRAISK